MIPRSRAHPVYSATLSSSLSLQISSARVCVISSSRHLSGDSGAGPATECRGYPCGSRSEPLGAGVTPAMLFGAGLVATILKLEEETTQFGEDQPVDAPAVGIGDSTSVALPRWLSYLAEPRHAVPILLIVGVALYLVNLRRLPFYIKGVP